MGEVSMVIAISVIAIFIIIIPFVVVYGIKSSRAEKMHSAYRRLKIGMSVKELIDLLGEPDSVGMSDANTRIMKWRNDERIMHSEYSRDTTRTITVYIRDNTVIAFDGDNINNRTW